MMTAVSILLLSGLTHFFGIICSNSLVPRSKRTINNIMIKSDSRFKDLRDIPSFFFLKNHSNFYSIDIPKPYL